MVLILGILVLSWVVMAHPEGHPKQILHKNLGGEGGGGGGHPVKKFIT